MTLTYDFYQLVVCTGVARNFNWEWEGSNWKKIVTFFGDVMVTTSQKWRPNFEVRFSQNQLEKQQFGQFTEL